MIKQKQITGIFWKKEHAFCDAPASLNVRAVQVGGTERGRSERQAEARKRAAWKARAPHFAVDEARGICELARCRSCCTRWKKTSKWVSEKTISSIFYPITLSAFLSLPHNIITTFVRYLSPAHTHTHTSTYISTDRTVTHQTLQLIQV